MKIILEGRNKLRLSKSNTFLQDYSAPYFPPFKKGEGTWKEDVYYVIFEFIFLWEFMRNKDVLMQKVITVAVIR